MSHFIDLDGLHERLFILQQVSLASKAYCQLQGITTESLEDDTPFQSTWGWTKGLVSNYCIECAVKLRLIQDFCEKSGSRGELASLEKQAMQGESLGEVLHGRFRLTIREAANKIVHATSAEVDFLQGTLDEGFIRYWDGRYVLQGSKGSERWKLSLDVRAWAKACVRYLYLLEQDERLLYLGQDFA